MTGPPARLLPRNPRNAEVFGFRVGRPRHSTTRHALVGGLLCALAAASVFPAGVAAHPFPLQSPAAVRLPPPGSGPVLTDCWLDVHYFRNLTSGVTDYCRGHLGYAPGALDCYQFTEQVCQVFLPDTIQWVETRQPVLPTVFPCPHAPQPSVCPRLSWP